MIEETVMFNQVCCPSCGFIYLLPAAFVSKRKKDGGNIYCPSGGDFMGHSWHFVVDQPKVVYRDVEKVVDNTKEIKNKIKKLEPRGKMENESTADYQKYMRNFNQVTRKIMKQIT